MFSQACNTINGVGPVLEAKLAQCGIKNLYDAVFYLPMRYQDRTHITPVRDLRPNDWAVVVGKICQVTVKQGKKPTLECYVQDNTDLLRLRFFHFNRALLQLLNSQPLVRIFGEVRMFAQSLEMVHPEYQVITSVENCPVDEAFTPIYRSTQGLPQSRLRQIIQQTIVKCKESLSALEWMTTKQLAKCAMPSIDIALQQLHSPSPDTNIQEILQGSHPAIRRIAFDELLAGHIAMQIARHKRQQLQAPLCQAVPQLTAKFIQLLPFNLTAAQEHVLQDISFDLAQSTPMLRLIQGDVGCGKTVVSAIAALQTIAHGYQVAFMAPTDLLTEQHAQTLLKWFAPMGIEVYRLSGQMSAKERAKTLNALQVDSKMIVVGTHALFQKDVTFTNLGLVIIDEQHRFGVEQRLLLQKKAQQHTPHQLLMTATPIPRTLVMTQLAHLDISIINERPPGRTPITTTLLNQTKRDFIIERLKIALKQGIQVYWVCTLIDESEKLQCMAATASFEYLQAELPEVRIGLVHGRMKARDKESIMANFAHGAIDILVATTVIEVGVDVANASLMIIENAERLGLSQLHQLRGRVGRGTTASHCVLMYQDPLSSHARARLKLLRETTDGFVIAEKDLELRGCGEVLGTRQTGERIFKVADLRRDQALLPKIAPVAEYLLKNNRDAAQQITQLWTGDVDDFLQG